MRRLRETVVKKRAGSLYCLTNFAAAGDDKFLDDVALSRRVRRVKEVDHWTDVAWDA